MSGVCRGHSQVWAPRGSWKCFMNSNARSPACKAASLPVNRAPSSNSTVRGAQ